NRTWLQPWEATIPGGVSSFDMRVSIRRLLQQHRDGTGYPFVMEYDGEIAGQLNIWGVSRGSLCSATIGYWVGELFAGRVVTAPACVWCASSASATRDCDGASSTSTGTGVIITPSHSPAKTCPVAC